MTKQEFLAMSLSRELKAIPENQNYKGKVVVIDGILNRYGRCHISTDAGNGWFPQFKVYDIKPILHPLSDLTNMITHKGESINAFEWIDEDCDTNESMQLSYTVVENIDCKYLPFWIVQKLIEWHFDIADLISKGEAIDVNTLPENPYAV